MTRDIRKRKFRIIFLLSLISFILIMIEQIISAYREELLGLNSGVAGYNFSYNFLFFSPTIIASTLLSIFALNNYYFTRKELKTEANKLSWFERISILPTILPLLFISYFLVFVIYNIISSMFIT